MRVLLIASDSALGLALQQHLSRWGRHELECISTAASRWKNERQAKKAVRRARPDILVDTRIEAAVDGGEKLSERDVERCAWLARACERSGTLLLLLSSARVFSGEQERPYKEQDAADCDDSVARLLQDSEAAVREHCLRHLILRLGPVFSHRGRTRMTELLEKLRAGGALTLDTHLRACPTAAEDVARVVAGVLDQVGTGAEAWGNFHYCSSDASNCYEFAEVLLACASQFLPLGESGVTLKERPADYTLSRRLDCNRLRNTFAIKQLPWRGFVADCVKAYFQQKEDAEH